MDSKKAIKQLNKIASLGNEMRLSAEGWSSDFQTLVSTIISARTRDEVTIPSSQRLFSVYPDVKSTAKASQSRVENLIKPANFYKNKAKNIIASAKILFDKYEGEVPHDINKLLELPGVGRKIANVFLSEVGKKAIGVDTHVAYISQKLGWTKNSNPAKIEKDLELLFPKNYWNKINQTLVRFGKTHQSRKQKDKILEEIKNSR